MVLAWIRQKLLHTTSDKGEDLHIEGQASLRMIGTATAEVVNAAQQPSETPKTKSLSLEALVPECSIPDEMELKEGALLSQEQKKDCRKLFEKLEGEASIEKWCEVRPSVVRLCTGLEKAKISWIKDLAKFASYLSFRLDQRLSGRRLDDDLTQAERTSLAALSYLVEIDDVIPDHVMGSGYADDAYIFMLAIKKLKAKANVDGNKLLDILVK